MTPTEINMMRTDLRHYLRAHQTIIENRAKAFWIARDFTANVLVVPLGFAPVAAELWVKVTEVPLALVTPDLREHTDTDLPRPAYSYRHTALGRRIEFVLT